MTIKAVRTIREEPTWDLVWRRNSIERLKRDKFPLDIVADLPDLIARGYEAVPEEDIVRLNWWGLTHDKPKLGTFMVRIKVSGGLLTPERLRGIGRISTTFGRNYGELTTRQGLQLHWVRLDQLPEVIEAIQATGLTTVGGEGDTVRNITGCPIAGISREEAFDVSPVIEQAARFFYGNRDYSNLPRKHKYTISACPGQCNAPEIHDVALVGVIKDGREGFAVRAGGGLANTPRLSRDLGVFVPAGEAIDVLRAVTDAWQTNLRYRVSRAKARIKFMVDDYGPEGVRRMVEERLGRTLEDGTAPEPTVDADHLGIHPQKQEGFAYAGFPVPMGWLTGTQMIEIADVVESIGGDIRLTRQQNFIVGNIPQGRLDELLEGIRALGLPQERNKVYGGSIACTSHAFCNYSVAETKGKLEEILEEFDRRFGEAVRDLKIFMDGCPHACAHHWVGDIGLQGTTTVDPETGKRIEAYDVSLRGGLGRKAAIGRPLLRRIPTGEITDLLGRLVAAWLGEQATLNGRGDTYGFRDFCDEREDEDLKAIAHGVAPSPAGEATSHSVAPSQGATSASGEGSRRVSPAAGAGAGEPADGGVPHAVVRIPGVLLEHTDGADEIEVPPGTVREVLEAVRRLHPALVTYLLPEPGEVNPAINLYIAEDDIRSLGGLDARLEAGIELTVLPALAGG